MNITTLRKSGSLTAEELELVKTLYGQWVNAGCPPTKEMTKVAVPRLIKTVEILKSRMEYEGRLETQVENLQNQLNVLEHTVGRYRNLVRESEGIREGGATQPKARAIITERDDPAKYQWQSANELADVLDLSTGYVHNMAAGKVKNRYNLERRLSKAKGRKYDFRVKPEDENA